MFLQLVFGLHANNEHNFYIDSDFMKVVLIVCVEAGDRLEKYGRVMGAMKEESN